MCFFPTEKFTAYCVSPDEPRHLSFRHRERHLEADVQIPQGYSGLLAVRLKSVALANAADSRKAIRPETERAPEHAAIVGRLVSMTLAPIANRRLLCYLTEKDDRKTPAPLETRTDANGEFRFPSVPVSMLRARLVAIDSLEEWFWGRRRVPDQGIRDNRSW